MIERIAAGDLGAKLRSQVVSWHPGAERDEVDEAFQEACLLAELRCRVQTEGEVFSWLRTTTHRELGHMQKRSRSRSRREVLVDVSAPGVQLAAVEALPPEAELIGHEDDAELEQVTGAVLARLSERQRQIVALHSRGRRRLEIAQHLGMTPCGVKRALERIMAEGRDELVRLAGRGCSSGEPSVARLAFGLASAREARQAQLHLTTCARCGALYERLDGWRAQVATVLPVPAVVPARPDLAEWALDRAGDGIASLKQHAAAGYARAVDATPLAGARPGAAVAAITGCLALGSGTTYCVTQSVDPIGGLAQIVAPARQQAHTKPVQRRLAQQPPAPTATTSPAPTIAPATPPAPAAQATPQPTPEPTPPPIAAEEIEPVVATSSARTAPQRSEPTPAPAPAGGPGEFDGP